MPRFSSSSLFLVVLLTVAGFGVYHSGKIPLELGGAATGSVMKDDAPQSVLDSAPEFAADDSPQLEVGGASSESLVEGSERDSNLIPRVLANAATDLSEPLEEPKAIRRGAPIRLVAFEEPAVAQKSEAPAAAKKVESPIESTNETPSDPPVRVATRPKDKDSEFDFTEIDRQIKAGQVVEAHKALSKLFWENPGLRSSVQERIDFTAKAIYFSPQLHVQEPYVVQAGDQLRKIATKHQVPWQYLSRLNRVEPKRLREGQKLKVIDGPFGAVVTLRDFELTLHHRGQYVRSYACCIGKNNTTPVGKFKVLNKVTNPQYTDPSGKVFASSDPKNPLGTHWINLGDSYGIHGTIEPNSIGQAQSRGCIRLLNADVAEVYDLLDLGTEVVIRP
ncbi:MAG: L,D-transpeptidase family protein [Planctomycetaceae bacterium]